MKMTTRNTGCLILILCSAMGVTSCGWTTQSTAQAWIRTLPEDPHVDVTGRWLDPVSSSHTYVSPYTTDGYGYGPTMMVLHQKGNKVFGTFRDYEVMGAVSEDEFSMAAIAEGVVYYTMHLSCSPEAHTMFGKICDGYFPEVKPHCRAITFEK